jgi:CRP-like cAMP-binding protein
MSKGISANAGGNGDILDWMHGEGKRQGERIPEFDVEQTLRLVHAVRDISARDAAAPSFWTALTPTKQADLVSAAEKQTFQAGTALMHEGEPAESVMIILDGRTKVCVREGGHVRVVAKRGPGDFVGESGRPPAGIRSATVIAIEPVLALVMKTEDYAAFVGEHFDVPDVVMRHVKDR